MEWKAIPGFPGYEASSDGQVKRCWKEKILRQSLSAKGYKVVSLRVGDKQRAHHVHRRWGMGYLLGCELLGCTEPGGHSAYRSRCSRMAVLASSVGVRSFRAASKSRMSRISLEILKGNCGFLFRLTIFFFFAMSEYMANPPLFVNHKTLLDNYLQLSVCFLGIS